MQLSDNDIIDLTLNLTVDGVVGLEGDNDENEKSTPLTGKLIQEGLQLCSKLENHFLSNDPTLNEPLNYNRKRQKKGGFKALLNPHESECTMQYDQALKPTRSVCDVLRHFVPYLL
ncbi:hypothetical protein TNCV_121101 [Trichonephila clavipes]|nr:hypothetical protein TNCV_121101 [Trichonephila clavipes]